MYRNKRGAGLGPAPQKQFPVDVHTRSAKIKSDPWLARRIQYLRHEIDRVKAGFNARQLLAYAEAAHVEFESSGALKARSKAWLAIKLCLAALGQDGRDVRHGKS
jgi:hypothetical protein